MKKRKKEDKEIKIVGWKKKKGSKKKGGKVENQKTKE